MSKSNDILVELGVLSISGTQPTGVNIRYDDEFELIEDELAKQGSLVDRGPVKWDKVAQAAINILSNKSKDLKVSCFLIRALYETDGFKGLAAGLRINQQLLENFWEQLYPTKQRARVNAYEWLGSKFDNAFLELQLELEAQQKPELKPELKPEQQSALHQLELIKQSSECIQKIEKFLKDKLSEKAPALGDFRRAINDLLELLTARKVAQEEHTKQQNLQAKLKEKTENSQSKEKNNDLLPTETTVVSDSHKEPTNQSIQNNSLQPVSGFAKIQSELTDEKDRNKIFRQCHEALRNVSACSVMDNLDSPSAYAINRFSTWMAINQLPMHNDHVTPLRPLPKDKINAYSNLFNSGNYQELIPQVEQSFSKAPFWLDAHRMVAQGLEALSLHESANQVKEHLGLFIRRFPMIIELRFSDNTGFADQQTKQWIHTDVLGHNSSQTVKADDHGEETDYDELITQANELAKKQKIKDAMQLFQDRIALQGSTRKQTFWQYYLARFCFDNAQQQVALALLKKIDGFLQKNNLQCWEPDLVKNVVYLLLLCHKQPSTRGNNSTQEKAAQQTNLPLKDKQDDDEINQLYSRLCQLDPVLALDFERI